MMQLVAVFPPSYARRIKRMEIELSARPTPEQERELHLFVELARDLGAERIYREVWSGRYNGGNNANVR